MSNKRFIDILAIGGIDLDLVLTVPYVPGRDEKAIGQIVGRLPGGPAANFACAASRLGLTVSSYCQVGDDEGGRIIIEDFNRYGVDTSLVEVVMGEETPFTVILIDPTGEKVIIVVPTFKPYYSMETAAQVMPNTRYMYTMPSNEEIFIPFARLARAHGAEIMVDIEPDICENRAKLERLLPHIDIASFNQFGFKVAAEDEPSIEAAQCLLDHGPHTVIVTRGSKGSLAVTQDEQAEAPGFDVTVADTTGAGDTFHAAYLKAVLERMPLAERLRFANASAALSVTAIGPRGNLPTPAEIDAFLTQSNPNGG